MTVLSWSYRRVVLILDIENKTKYYLGLASKFLNSGADLTFGGLERNCIYLISLHLYTWVKLFQAVRMGIADKQK